MESGNLSLNINSNYLALFALGLALMLAILTILLIKNHKTQVLYKAAMSQIEEANKHFGIMLNATPLICNLWSKDYQVIDCNEEALKLYEMDKKEYMSRFLELTPEFQPNGLRTADHARNMLDMAFREGKCVFESTTQKLDGTPIPLEVTLIRVAYGDDYVVVGYGRDLREHKKMIDGIKQREKMLEVLTRTPSCLWHSTKKPLRISWQMD